MKNEKSKQAKAKGKRRQQRIWERKKAQKAKMGREEMT